MSVLENLAMDKLCSHRGSQYSSCNCPQWKNGFQTEQDDNSLQNSVCLPRKRDYTAFWTVSFPLLQIEFLHDFLHRRKYYLWKTDFTSYSHSAPTIVRLRSVPW